MFCANLKYAILCKQLYILLYLVGPQRLLPGHVLIVGAPLYLHLLQHTLQEGPVSENGNHH